MNKYLNGITDEDVVAIQLYRNARAIIKSYENVKKDAQRTVFYAIIKDIANNNLAYSAEEIEEMSDGIISKSEVFALVREIEELPNLGYTVKCNYKTINTYFCRCTADGVAIPGSKIITKSRKINIYAFYTRGN